MLRRWRSFLLRLFLVLLLAAICIKLRWLLALPVCVTLLIPELICGLLPQCPSCDGRTLRSGKPCRPCRNRADKSHAAPKA